jgi:hypothetical protein
MFEVGLFDHNTVPAKVGVNVKQELGRTGDQFNLADGSDGGGLGKEGGERAKPGGQT